MDIPQRHIAFRIVSALIVVVLLIPIAIKLAHSFEHETHTACGKVDTANFHECEVDCVFFKYNLQQHYLKYQNYNLSIYLTHSFETPLTVYDFFYEHRVLTFSLRGPPTLA